MLIPVASLDPPVFKNIQIFKISKLVLK